VEGNKAAIEGIAVIAGITDRSGIESGNFGGFFIAEPGLGGGRGIVVIAGSARPVADEDLDLQKFGVWNWIRKTKRGGALISRK
jgi:hypothetical protein